MTDYAPTEEEFLHAVMGLAAWAGWRRYHPRPARYKDGRHATHYSGEQGFPDLVLAHPRRGVIFAELKTEKGRLSEPQKLWIEELTAGGVEAYVWRPSDLEEIKKRLGFPKTSKKAGR